MSGEGVRSRASSASSLTCTIRQSINQTIRQSGNQANSVSSLTCTIKQSSNQAIKQSGNLASMPARLAPSSCTRGNGAG
eukprot:6171094-Prymnesium_polylepis.1